jgi:hypothetical protein
MAITVPNTNRIRATSDPTQADAVVKIAAYATQNVTPAAGNKVAAPTAVSHPIRPV